MSYPGAIGYATNLACDTALQRSTDQFNFQLNTGGGGSSENNLQSPAAVVADSTGNVVLNMISAGTPGTQGATLNISSTSGDGSANLNITDTTGNNATINMVNMAGGNSVIRMGQAASQVQIYVAGSLPGQLQVQDGNTGVSYLTVDTVAGTVTSNAPLSVFDPTLIGNNALTLSRTNPTSSSINQTVATGGTLSLGSSEGNPAAIVMSDSIGAGTGRTVINNFVPPSTADSQILLANIPTGQTDLPQPNPLVSGLYLFAISPGANDVRTGVATMAYYSTGSSTWRVGGAVYGIPVGGGNTYILPKNDQSVMTVANTTGGALNGANVVYCRLFTGLIGGW